jgi:Ca2+-binding RTX toxin-like protein
MGGNISGFNTVRLANGGADTLTLNNANVSGIKGALTVICGDKGNTVNASAVTTLSKLIIDGGAGKDVLTGTGNPGGRTIFVFSAKALTAADKITASGFNNELDLTTPGTVAAGGVSAVQIYRLANGGKNTLVLKSANFAGLPSNTVQIYGGNAGNTIDGSGVTGASQNLQIYGGGGADVLKGGAGNDVFALSAATLTGSVVEGGGGNNELEITTAGILPVAAVTGIETYVLADSGANALSLTSANFAGVAGHVITVSDGNGDSTVSGSTLPAADRLNLYAGTGADELTGGAGGDALFAGGDTTMTGKAGANQFTFSAPGNNTITDFGASSANQMVFVSGSGFSLPGATIAPKPLGGLFTAGAFTSPSQRFSYTGGKLFYSATGSVSSEHLVATLSGSPVLNPAHLLFMS